MEVSDKFQLKRQTFQLAVYYIDAYAIKVGNVKLANYQLLGVTSLFVACKLEVSNIAFTILMNIQEIYYPKVSEFADITDGKCTSNDLFEMEIKIYTKLHWLMNPQTLNSWANLFMLQWDRYVDANPLRLYILNYCSQDSTSSAQRGIPKFNSDKNEDYQAFRYVMQVLDLMLLDTGVYHYQFEHLALSAIIIVLAFNFDICT